MKTITSGKSLGQALDAVIKESVRSMLHNRAMNEKDKQDDTSNLFDDNSSDGGNESPNDDKQDNDEEQKSKTGDDETEKLKDANIEAKDIVEKLNTIRSGKSFKDSAIANNLDQYINSLKSPEKTALFAFLKGIAQITTGEIDAKAATEPHDHPADVAMKKTDHSKHTFSIKPNVIKKNVKTEPEKTSTGEEDTTAPKKVPIQPKTKQS